FSKKVVARYEYFWALASLESFKSQIGAPPDEAELSVLNGLNNYVKSCRKAVKNAKGRYNPAIFDDRKNNPVVNGRARARKELIEALRVAGYDKKEINEIASNSALKRCYN